MTGADGALRIAVLAHNLRAAGGLSVGRNVIASLARVADRHEYLLILPENCGYEAIAKPSHSKSLYIGQLGGGPGRMWFERFTLPRITRDFRPDVVWGLGNFALRRPGCKQAILLHKPHYIYGPEDQRCELWRYSALNELGRRRLRRCLPYTQLVFCQTRTACDRFRATYSYSGRTAIMPNAVSKLSLTGDARQSPEVFDRLRGKYVLFCLTKYYAHKNLEALADVFVQHGDVLRDVSILLTIEAGQHPRAGRLIARLEEPRLRESLINVGPIDQSELAGYYGRCDGLILPTLLESFSGTYLEAMQFKKPILTSDRDFARDVCGPAALYFDPCNPASIRDAILALKNSPETRDRLVLEGTRRMQSFFRDWDSIVADAVRELENLVRGEACSISDGPGPQASGVMKSRATA